MKDGGRVAKEEEYVEESDKRAVLVNSEVKVGEEWACGSGVRTLGRRKNGKHFRKKVKMRWSQGTHIRTAVGALEL